MPHLRLWPLCILLLLTGLARADYRDYAKGVEAASKNDWSKVDQLVGAAYGDDKVPKDRARLYGQYFRPYIPQYYLALSAFKRNDCAAVMRYLNEPAYKSLVDARGKAAEEASQDGAMRSRCATPIAGPGPKPPPTPPVAPPASLSSAQREAAQRGLATLARALAEAQGLPVPAAQLVSARGRADQARLALEAAVKAQDAAALQAALQTAAAAGSELDRLASAARSAAAAPAPPTPTPTPPPARVPPAAGLQTALAAFIGGDYNGVLKVASSGMEPRSRAHTALLRGAAHYSLYLLGGETDAARRGQAEAEIREARQALAAIRANPKYFSPRFVEFFNRTR